MLLNTYTSSSKLKHQAPEVVEGESEQSVHSDTYAVGGVLN